MSTLVSPVLNNVAGHDLILALIYTCPLAFIAAGIVGIIGLRWVRNDRAAAEQELPFSESKQV